MPGASALPAAELTVERPEGGEQAQAHYGGKPHKHAAADVPGRTPQSDASGPSRKSVDDVNRTGYGQASQTRRHCRLVVCLVVAEPCSVSSARPSWDVLDWRLSEIFKMA